MKLARLAVIAAALALGAVAADEQSQIDLSPEVVQRVQERLREMGYDPGPVDGKWGPKTRQAVKQLQQDREHAATGQLDLATLAFIDPDLHALAAVAHTSNKAAAGASSPAPK
jgi:peptidoglycan hydrolase-like protein with peptidoglycan-binding domain